jgi:hypothetical protein
MELQASLRWDAKFRTGCSLLAAAAAPAAVVAGFFTILTPGLDYAFISPIESIVISVLGFFVLFAIAFIVAGVHVVALGLPAFFLGLRLRAIHWWSCVIVAFTIGGLPSEMWRTRGDYEFAWNNFVVLGMLGAIGGLAFWFLWRFWVNYEFWPEKPVNESGA